LPSITYRGECAFFSQLLGAYPLLQAAAAAAADVLSESAL